MSGAGTLPAATGERGEAFQEEPDFIFDGLIASLWRKGLNTKEIATHARVRESRVANRLARLRDAGAL